MVIIHFQLFSIVSGCFQYLPQVRVTVRLGFPRHVLFFGPWLGVRAGFLKIGRMSGFCTLEPPFITKVPKSQH